MHGCAARVLALPGAPESVASAAAPPLGGGVTRHAGCDVFVLLALLSRLAHRTLPVLRGADLSRASPDEEVQGIFLELLTDFLDAAGASVVRAVARFD